MRLGIRRALAGFAAALVGAIGVSVPGGGPVVAGSCARVIYVNPEISVREGAGKLTFTVFSGGCGVPGDVMYTATSGTATSPADFKLASGKVSWTAGDTTVRKIVVSIANDGINESNVEDFTVTLSTFHKDIKIAVPKAHGRIIDDDGPVLVWVIDDQVCPEIQVNTGTPPGVPWLTQEQRYLCDFGHAVPCLVPGGMFSNTQTITWGTVDGTATAGVDFVGVVNQVDPVPPNEPFLVLSVTMIGTPPGTPSRSFAVRIFAVSMGTIGDSTAVITIGVI